MMMILRKIVMGFCFLLMTFATIFAQGSSAIPDQIKKGLNVLQTTVPFLTIAPDSRAGAMGDLGVATTPDGNSQNWNAAKYAFIKDKMGVSLSYTPWLRNLVKDINLGYLSFYYRFDDKQVISSSLRYFSLGEIIFRTEDGTYSGQYTPYEFAIDAAYSRLLGEHLSGALTLRYIRSDITGGGTAVGSPSEYNPGNSFAADLGVYYQHDFKISDKSAEYAWGVCISNLGTKISYTEGAEKQFIPANMRIGARLKLDMDDYNSITGELDLNKLLVPTPPIYYSDSVDANGDQVVQYGRPIPTSLPLSWIQSFYDAPGGFTEEMHEIMISAGLEYWYREQFAIRGGYFYEHESKGNRKYFAVGVGMKLNVFYLDFSYLISATGTSNPLANTMRFTLGLNFGKK
jgi:Type IX secretion system protein PorV